MVDTVRDRPGGSRPRAGGAAVPAGGHPPGPAARAGAIMRRYRLAPYLLLLPSAAAIGLVLVWPTVQIGLISMQNYGLPQLTGAQPAQWVGAGNYTKILAD